MIKIEVWSDFTCPFCYIGKRNLERAIARFTHGKHVKVEFKSYRLGQMTDSLNEMSFSDMLVDKYDMSQRQIELLENEIIALAEEADIPLDLSCVKYYDTSLAHRLTKYAQRHGLETEMISRLFQAYFTKTVNLNDKMDMVNLAVEIGLDRDEVEGILSLNGFKSSIKCDELEAEEIGINSVPFYVFNEVHSIKGSQSDNIFLDILEELMDPAGEAPEEVVSKSGNQFTYCTGTNCEKVTMV